MTSEDKERFELAREIIRHEDGLVNNRVTWLLILQGFLFSAFVAGVKLYEDLHVPGAGLFVTLGLALIGALGIIASLTANKTIAAAHEQINTVRKWWEKGGSADSFPPVAGRWKRYYWSTGRLPRVLIVIWCLLLALLFVGVIVSLCGCPVGRPA